MILVDTSAWVEFLRATGSPVHRELGRLLREQPADVAVTEPVVMELLCGPTDPDVHRQLEQLLDSVAVLALDPVLDYRAAAAVYRAARGTGRTVRSVVDCLVAVVAVSSDVPVLQRDRDFDVLSGVLPGLRLHPAGE